MIASLMSNDVLRIFVQAVRYGRVLTKARLPGAGFNLILKNPTMGWSINQ